MPMTQAPAPVAGVSCFGLATAEERDAPTAKAVLDVALFALGCVIFCAVAEALFDLLNVLLSFCC
jgi:hypothetical protein